ncbi:MAG: extracellular solute-binding protein [Eubacteriales bacterium]|nr:extracellular solute-binding protein [Eubacteriales bacterium]
MRLFGKKSVVLLCAVCIAAVLVGCAPAAGKTPETAATPEPTPQPTVYKLTVVNWPGEQVQTFEQTTIGRRLTAQTNVKVEITYVNGDTQEELRKIAASGNLPDMIWSDGQWQELISAGSLVDLTERLAADPEGMASYYRPGELAAVNGGSAVYALGTQRNEVTDAYTAAGYYLRYDVLESAGFPQITTLAQYCQIIEDYLKAHPSEQDGTKNIGLGLAPGAWSFGSQGTGAYASVSGFLDYGIFAVDPSLNTVKMTMQSKWLKDWLRVVNDLYSKGCLDSELFTQTQEQYEQKVTAGSMLGFYDPTGALAAKAEASLTEAKRNYVAFPVVLNGVERDYCRGTAQYQTGGIAITTACQDVDGVYEFIKLMASDDVQMLNKWGVEGADYSFTEEGRFTRSAAQWKNMKDASYCAKRGIGMLNMFPNREGGEDRNYGKFIEGNWTNPQMSAEYPANNYTAAQLRTIEGLKLERLGKLFGAQEYSQWGDLQAKYEALGEDSAAHTAVKQAIALADEYHVKLIKVGHKQLDELWAEYQSKLAAVPGLADVETQAQQWINEGLGK